VDTINNQCFCTPPNDPKFPYLFDMNETKQKHHELIFLQSEGDVFILRAQDRHIFNHFKYKMMQTSHEKYI
jgi:hypothetical protein